MHAVFVSTLAAIALGHGSPTLVAQPKTYLIAEGKPTIEVFVPTLPGAAMTSLAPPTGPFHVKTLMSLASFDWLLDADEHPIFTAKLVRCDETGRVSDSIELHSTTLTGVGFQTIGLARGGVPLIDLGLTPTSAALTRPAPATMPVPAPSPGLRIMTYDLIFGTKEVKFVESLQAFTVGRSGSDFSTSISLVVNSGIPAEYSRGGTGRLGLKLQAAGRPQTKLNLTFRSSGITPSGPRRALLRMGGIRFERG